MRPFTVGLRKDLRKWTPLVMDLNSRIEVIPRLLYLFLSLPIHIPDAQFAKWNKQMSRFI